MMDNFELSKITISLAILAVIWFGLFGSFRRDEFRSRIRQVRDSLFDFMWEKGYSFETPAYRETRQILNGILRASNRLGPVMFFLCLLLSFDDEETPDSLDKLEHGPLKKQLLDSRHRAVRELLIFVYLQGIFGLFVRAVRLFLGVVNLAYCAKKWALTAAEHFMNNVAFRLGRPDCTASGQFRSLAHTK